MSSSIKPKDYRARIVDKEIEEKLQIYGALEIQGTRWSGKTWTARSHGKSIVYLDDPSTFSLVTLDANMLLLNGEEPRVIDEWQLAPYLWDRVRHLVDDGANKRGRWILTGSSTPNKEEIHHSGVGRIGRVHMNTMTLYELGLSSAQVSLASLFKGEAVKGYSSIQYQDLASHCVHGGWPAAASFSESQATRVAQDYLELTFEKSQYGHNLNMDIARRIAHSIARTTGQLTTQKTLINDAFSQIKDEERESTMRARLFNYLAYFKEIYFIDEIPGWLPPARSPRRVRQRPKRYLCDTSLTAALLGLTAKSLALDAQTFGMLFEAMCMHDLGVYARAQNSSMATPLHYYHDDTGLEVDAILELANGEWAAFEIKLGEHQVESAAKNLLRMKKKLCNNPKAQVSQPKFLAVIVGNGSYAYTREDQVHVIPLGCLCP